MLTAVDELKTVFFISQNQEQEEYISGCFNFIHYFLFLSFYMDLDFQEVIEFTFQNLSFLFNLRMAQFLFLFYQTLQFLICFAIYFSEILILQLNLHHQNQNQILFYLNFLQPFYFLFQPLFQKNHFYFLFFVSHLHFHCHF